MIGRSRAARTLASSLSLLGGLLLGLVPASAQTPEGPIPVAVLDLQTNDVSADNDAQSRDELAQIAQTATRTLRGEFSRSANRPFALVDEGEPTNPAAPLSKLCDRNDCAVAIGRALGAQLVIVGTVTKVSTIIWFVTLQAIDVESRHVVREVPIELKGDISQLLPKGMAALARWISEPDAEDRASAVDHRLSRHRVMELVAAESDGDVPILAGADLTGLDLSGLDFKQADLSGADLSNADLSGANLFGTNMTSAILHGASLRTATLDVAVLRDANLVGADLSGASLYATILAGADLTDANLSGARIIAVLTDAKLIRAKLSHADMGADRGNQPMGLMRTDLTGADLTGADITGANLAKADLTRANLTGADLTRADLSYAELKGAILRSIRGRDAILGLETTKNLDLAIFDPR